MAKQCIPRGRRKKYVPHWGKECETLYCSFIQAQWGLPLAEPLRPYSLECNRREERWKEAVNSIDLLHSSCKAWSTINKLTGSSIRSSHLCHVSTNSIASQLVKNWAHKTGGCDSTKPINKQLYDLWKIPTPEGHSISEPFKSEEFDASLTHLRPGKSPAMDSIFSELILHTSQILVLRLPQFLHAPSQNPKEPEKNTHSGDL